MKKQIILFVILMAIPFIQADTITRANFNAQIFGDSKIKKLGVGMNACFTEDENKIWLGNSFRCMGTFLLIVD